ncbi:MAG TPA: hypothetical protein VEX43_10740 [Chthoniobacterales bacterium]|nr:hypothetical protein [Chthoniobacterales bacterium]
MRIIWKSSPSPRLLNTVASDIAGKKAEPPTGKFSLKRASLFSGNGRAIFVGIVVGAAIFAILGVTYTRHQSQKRQREAGARAEASSASALILTNQIQVSAISLGEPRLAIVNGKQVTEGESITITTPDQLTTVRLQVVKIADGRIDLSDGTQVITVRLETSRGPIRKP